MVPVGAATAPELRAGGHHVRILTPPRARRRCRRQRDRRRLRHLGAGPAAIGTDAAGACRQRAAVVPLPARRGDPEVVGRRLGQGGDGGGVPGVAEARRRADVARAGRGARTALARQRGGMGLHDPRPMPRHHHRPAGPFAGRRFRSRRRLVLPARVWPFDPGHRPRGLPVRAGVRQRLLLGVRHLQHHRLDRSHPARGAGEDLRRAGGDLRQLPQARGLHRQGAGAAAAAGRSGSGRAQQRGADPPLPAAGAAPAELSGRHQSPGVAARIPGLDHHDRRPDAHQAGRPARDALASQCRRVAVLPRRPRPHERVRLARPRACRRIRRRRRRLCAAGLRPLHRERRQRTSSS